MSIQYYHRYPTRLSITEQFEKEINAERKKKRERPLEEEPSEQKRVRFEQIYYDQFSHISRHPPKNVTGSLKRKWSHEVNKHSKKFEKGEGPYHLEIAERMNRFTASTYFAPVRVGQRIKERVVTEYKTRVIPFMENRF